jgi:uncharacterized protein
MASSLLTLLDDIATLLDDVSVMTKVAAKKTAGVLGDDLALNAQQVAGVSANRELPVVWAVAVGSVKNKAILVPLALGISTLAPWAVSPLLMVGGAYLCFEGVEKLAHKYLHGSEAEAHERELAEAVSHPEIDLVTLERDKIRGAVRTDFVLSAEIITIALGSAAEATLLERTGVLLGISAIMTVGVYGFVAAIVKLDDAGYALQRSGSGVLQRVGGALVAGAPWLMRALSVGGTLAMFLVGGGILVHGLPPLHHFAESLGQGAGPLAWLAAPAVQLVCGLVTGALALALVTLAQKARGAQTH